jgi:hypothetical protein
VSRAVSAAQKHQLEAWERHADIVLHPDVQNIAWDDFDRIEESIEAGAEAARGALPQMAGLVDFSIQHRGTPVAGMWRESGAFLLPYWLGSFFEIALPCPRLYPDLREE